MKRLYVYLSIDKVVSREGAEEVNGGEAIIQKLVF